jgi:hypothetical protein
MGDVFAAPLIVVAFLSRLGVFPGRVCAARSDDPAPFGYRAASPGAVIGFPACTAQVTYRLIIGR